MSNVKKSRATLVGVVLAFLIPVIGAKLVLNQNWYQGAVTNQGTMMVPPLELQSLAELLPSGWRVVLRDDGACDDACSQALYAMNQLDVALGKETERVTPVLVSAAGTQLNLANTPLVRHVENASLAQALLDVPAHHLMIIDPLGNVVLYYPSFSDEAAMRAEAKALLSDLRTMLKLSKIG